jgi:hypothetical protein
MRLATLIVTALAVACVPRAGLACSGPPAISAVVMVRDADAIVRAKAVDYARPPADPARRTTGVPDSRIRFTVLEVIRGSTIETLELPGYLSDTDDFNDHEAPYGFVRPNGRTGSCYANTYRSGAEFLLVLKRTQDGAYTVNWYALGPTNEQLHSDHDPWLTWVRQESKKSKLPNIQMEPAGKSQAGGRWPIQGLAWRRRFF